MSAGLVIHIMDDDGNLKWFLEGEEASASASSKESLAEKSWDDFNAEVIVFVPTADVYLTKAKLPALSQAKLRKMVPYAIEDEITSDVTASHFATATPDSSGYTSIAVVNRERMEAWLQCLPMGIKEHISVMIPDVLALPWKQGTWTIADLGQQILVRQEVDSGFSIEKENVVEIIGQYMRENNHKIEQVLLISPQARSDIEKPITDELHLPVIHQALEGEWIVLLSNNIDKNSSLNLLQGQFQSDYSLRGIPRLKRIFAAMVISWFLLMTAIGFIKFSILSYQSHRLNNELTVLYNAIFPGESRTISPKKRVETALAAVKKAKEQSIFLRLVAAASPVLVNAKGISVQSAIFSNSQLEVQVEASDFALLDKVTTDLRRKGLAAEQNRATKVGAVTQAHLVIKEAR